MGAPTLLHGLSTVKDSYNIDAIAARVGAAAYEDIEYTRTVITKVRASRQSLTTELENLGYRVWPSEANFLLVKPGHQQARNLYQHLKTNGILVRYFDTPELSDKLRITVGTEEQNQRLLAALKIAT